VYRSQKRGDSVTHSELVIPVDEGQELVLGQLLRVHPCLRIVNYDPVHPGPEEPLSMANTKEDNQNALCS